MGYMRIVSVLLTFGGSCAVYHFVPLWFWKSAATYACYGILTCGTCCVLSCVPVAFVKKTFRYAGTGLRRLAGFTFLKLPGGIVKGVCSILSLLYIRLLRTLDI